MKEKAATVQVNFRVGVDLLESIKDAARTRAAAERTDIRWTDLAREALRARYMTDKGRQTK
jgi:hypothetical protein